MPPIIRIENLSKSYRIAHGQPRASYRTLRETLVDLAAAPLRRLRGQGNGRVEEFWALKDINLEVQQGEVLGIIGRNGAGKSTLLKILSRITPPTSGRAEIRGRVGSLLEVGTGFHPELTGRENIYLNGAILGMRRREIQRKFDEIVDFSGIEKFLDTPVKRYSNGMYVRLAFAVAAHLDPEILIVDEVLAVGDIGFQRKCLGRMRDVSHSGRTILFVSHNMAAVESLCHRAILLDEGRIAHDDTVQQVIEEYQRTNREAHNGRVILSPAMRGRRGAHPVVTEVALLDGKGRPTAVLPVGREFNLCIKMQPTDPIHEPTIGIGIDDNLRQRRLTVHTPLKNSPVTRIDHGCQVHCRIPTFPLAPGDYTIKLAVSVGRDELDVIEEAFSFAVVNAELFDEGRGFHGGICVAPSYWDIVEYS